MEFGPHQLQIAVSFVMILGAASVALIVDFLKGNNEQLRELAIELNIRRHDDLRRAQKVAAEPRRTPVHSPPSVKAEPAQRVQAASKSAPVPQEPRRMPSTDALAAMERGARRAASPLAHSLAAQRLASAAQRRSEPKSSPRTDWGALLSRRPQTMPGPQPDLLQAIVAETNRQLGQDELPSGFHAGFEDGYILSRLVQSRRPVSGLVVSIGVNTPRNSDGSMPQPVCALIQSLIGPEDFACQSNPEEFLLIYPGERGAAAQRKLSQIAQQLWDFQLRSLGTFSILFSWGGVEVSSESIDEAISAANDRMQETRRSRKILALESPLRHAV